jgi:hypothetical protein
MEWAGQEPPAVGGETGQVEPPAVDVEWRYEDEVPELSDDLFGAAYKASRIIGGVRMYPFIRIDGVLHMAVITDKVA